jgi:hypothetical protein
MLKIYSNEGERVINLVDVELMSEEKWFEKMYNALTETEIEIISEISFEGDFVDNVEDYSDNDFENMTFDEYINDIKEWVVSVLED